MPTTQKPQQKQTKATQKVGGSAKKPVTKAMEGGSTKKPVTKAMEGGSTAPSKCKTTRGGSAKGGGMFNYEETKQRSEDNRKLIKLLYNLIDDLVKKLTSDLNTKYDFKVFIENESRFETQTKPISDLTSLINNLNNKEYIRSISRISVITEAELEEPKKPPSN